MKAELRIATRQSKLALWQAEHVARKLRDSHPALRVTLVPMTTQGDRVLDRSLAQVGGKGLFIKELEIAINEGRADIAVHSMKDVPSELPPEMVLAAMLSRADPRDALVSNRFDSLQVLPHGARVGTSSLRRRCQLQHLRGDLRIYDVRGNVETRLRKLDADEFDAILLASAGLERLGLSGRIAEYIDPDVSLPAVGQGVIGIECRRDDADSHSLVTALNDSVASICVTAERAFARRLQGSCQSPIGAYATLADGKLLLRGMVASLDGASVLREQLDDESANAERAGERLAERMLAAGADKFLQPALAQLQ
jgi:hydroxymethylbilane synthase